LLCILFLCAAVAFLQFKPNPGPGEPVILLEGPFKILPSARDRFSMTLGPRRKWVARAEQAIFGERRSVRISAEIMELSGPALTNLETSLRLPAPTYATNGVKIWFLGAASLMEIGRRDSPARGIEILTTPRIVTAEGMASSVFMGQSMPTKTGMTPVGIGMMCSASVRDGYTTLLTELFQSEFIDGIVRTNFTIHARLNVPKGKGVFVMQQSNGAATNGWGMVIHPMR
jgi:hypothetical protein